MEQELTYKVSAKDLKETLVDIIRREIRAEYKAIYNQRIINAETAAMIHGVDYRTVIAYAESGDIVFEPKTEKEQYRFRLGNILEVDFKALRKQLKNKRV